MGKGAYSLSELAESAEEKPDLLGLLEIAKASVDAEFKPDSLNFGINDSSAAGQTDPTSITPDTKINRGRTRCPWRCALDHP